MSHLSSIRSLLSSSLFLLSLFLLLSLSSVSGQPPTPVNIQASSTLSNSANFTFLIPNNFQGGSGWAVSSVVIVCDDNYGNTRTGISTRTASNSFGPAAVIGLAPAWTYSCVSFSLTSINQQSTPSVAISVTTLPFQFCSGNCGGLPSASGPPLGIAISSQDPANVRFQVTPSPYTGTKPSGDWSAITFYEGTAYPRAGTGAIRFNTSSLMSNQIEFRSLRSNTDYALEIRALNDANLYSKMITFNFTTLPFPVLPPVPPSALRVIDRAYASIRVGFNASSSGGFNSFGESTPIKQYRVTAQRVNPVTFVPISGSPAVVVTDRFSPILAFGLLYNSTYNISVCTVSQSDVLSTQCPWMIAATLPIQQPFPPINLQIVSVTSAGATVQFTAPANTGNQDDTQFTPIAIAGYTLFAFRESTGTTDLVQYFNSTITSIVFTGLAPVSWYQIRLSTVNAVTFASFQSQPVRFRTGSLAVPPSCPTDTYLSVIGQTSVTVDFTAASSGGRDHSGVPSDVLTNTIIYGSLELGIFTLDCKNPPCDITGLTPSTNYTVYVVAVSTAQITSQNCLTQYSVPFVTQPPFTASQPPVSITVTPSWNSALISYVKPVDQGTYGAVILTTFIYYRPQSGSTILTQNVTGALNSVVLVNLTASTSYVYIVEFLNSNNLRSNSPLLIFTTQPPPNSPPAAVSGITTSARAGGAIISFTFPNPGNNNQFLLFCNATLFYLSVPISQGIISQATGPTITLTNLIFSTSYDFSITCLNNNYLISPVTTVQFISGPPNTAPSRPSTPNIVSVTSNPAASSTISFTLTRPVNLGNNGATFWFYFLNYTDCHSNSYLLQDNQNTGQLPFLSPQCQYVIMVAAVNSNGMVSQYSIPAVVTTPEIVDPNATPDQQSFSARTSFALRTSNNASSDPTLTMSPAQLEAAIINDLVAITGVAAARFTDFQSTRTVLGDGSARLTISLMVLPPSGASAGSSVSAVQALIDQSVASNTLLKRQPLMRYIDPAIAVTSSYQTPPAPTEEPTLLGQSQAVGAVILTFMLIGIVVLIVVGAKCYFALREEGSWDNQKKGNKLNDDSFGNRSCFDCLRASDNQKPTANSFDSITMSDFGADGTGNKSAGSGNQNGNASDSSFLAGGRGFSHSVYASGAGSPSAANNGMNAPNPCLADPLRPRDSVSGALIDVNPMISASMMHKESRILMENEYAAQRQSQWNANGLGLMGSNNGLGVNSIPMEEVPLNSNNQWNQGMQNNSNQYGMGMGNGMGMNNMGNMGMGGDMNLGMNNGMGMGMGGGSFAVPQNQSNTYGGGHGSFAVPPSQNGFAQFGGGGASAYGSQVPNGMGMNMGMMNMGMNPHDAYGNGHQSFAAPNGGQMQQYGNQQMQQQDYNYY